MSGIVAMLLGSVLPTTGVAIGASGAIYGLLAAALMAVFRGPAATTEDRRLRRVLVGILIAAIIISLLPGVSLAGHLVGFIGGAITAGSIVRWLS